MRQRRMGLTHGLIAALSACVMSCTSLPPSPPAVPGPLTEQVWSARQALLREGSADDLAAAALLSPSKRNDELRAGELRGALLWTRRAVLLAPRRKDLLALELNLCSALDGCDTRPLESRLHLLDPANGLPELAALERARVRGDDAERDAAVIALSRASRIDFYTNTLSGRLARAMLRTGEINPGLIVDSLTSGLAVADNLQRG